MPIFFQINIEKILNKLFDARNVLIDEFILIVIVIIHAIYHILTINLMQPTTETTECQITLIEKF